MKRKHPWNIAIIGAGKVGNVLGRLFVERGDRIVAVISRTSVSARRAGRYLGCHLASTSIASLPAGVDLVCITTPHAAVSGVALALAALPGRTFRGVAVFHASGMLTADPLEPLRRRGATVFSFHPLQTFPRDYPPAAIIGSVPGIYYGADGSPAALRVARSVASRLGGRVLSVPPEHRAFYHASCVVASNHLTGLMHVLSGMFGGLGKKPEQFYPVYAPIIMATLRNVARTGPAAALSGPVARGGVETVNEHCQAVRRRTPVLFPFFAAMTLETIRLARRKGSITKAQSRELINLVRAHLHAHSRPKEKQ
jgi:predicted short-subunit dehydrogenase-like oxidoreductase (DUF2520 family)